jgi:hypothetical protein
MNPPATHLWSHVVWISFTKSFMAVLLGSRKMKLLIKQPWISFLPLWWPSSSHLRQVTSWVPSYGLLTGCKSPLKLFSSLFLLKMCSWLFSSARGYHLHWGPCSPGSCFHSLLSFYHMAYSAKTSKQACHLLACWFLNLFLRPWRWRQYVPPKRRLKLNALHGIISQKMTLFNSDLW